MISFTRLPYKKNALDLVISENTLNFHYDKHHAAYVQKANELLENTYLKDKSLVEINKITAFDKDYTALFNNAAQVFNHEFYWQSLALNSKPSDSLMLKIEADFSSFLALKEALVARGMAQFGSGWVWLILKNGVLQVISTANADTPIASEDEIPLLCIDVWEHGYYLDYQNKRLDYLKNVVENALNWQFASENYDNI